MPNPLNKPYINHKDGDTHNNSLKNLEWCTASENNKDAFIYVRIGGEDYSFLPTELAYCEEGKSKHEKKKLESLLIAEEPVDKIKKEKSFDPKFNAREEFVVWVREEFPELMYQKGHYEIPSKRRREVYEAAIAACRHGIETTGACVQRTFQNNFSNLMTDGCSDLEVRIYSIVSLIECVSANLGNENRHYGTILARK